MRPAAWLIAINLTALAVMVPLCLADCLPQRVATESCHQEGHPSQEAAETCLDCLAGDFVKPKTVDDSIQLHDPLPATGGGALANIDTFLRAAPKSALLAPPNSAAPPLILRL